MNNYLFKRLDDSMIQMLAPLYKDAFNKDVSIEEIKNKFAKDNKINLLRIRFDEIKEINDILDKIIKQWQIQ